MAESYTQGYPEDRFKCDVNSTFHCPICMNVLKDPMQCHRNEHFFCSACITKHLNENSLTCPMCMEELTTETLAKPPRIVTNYLSTLKITCDFAERGCPEVVELGNLETHVAGCSYLPVLCSKCTRTMDKKDKVEHDANVCEFRVVQCEDCGEEMSLKKYSKHGCLLSKEVDKLKLEVLEMKDQFVEMRSSQEKWHKQIRDEIRNAIGADVKDKIKMRDTVKNVDNCIPDSQGLLCAVSDSQGLHAADHNNSGLRGDIVALGGRDEYSVALNSVETFNWNKMSWTPLPPMRRRRFSATSACYQNKIIVAGGYVETVLLSLLSKKEPTDEAEQFVFDQKPEQWLDSPIKLPYKCSGHKSVIYNNCLVLVGGCKGKRDCTNVIHEILLQPPYTRRFKSHIPQPVSYHGAELFNDKILIVGGTPTGVAKDGVSTVLLYDLNSNECKEMQPLPFAMVDMATVKWGDDSIIIIGGTTVNYKVLNTVFIYNYKEEWCVPLPSMKYKRAECAAVISGNAIVVMGGYNEDQGYLNTVEYFTFENSAWKDLPSMSEKRNKVTAVVKPVAL